MPNHRKSSLVVILLISIIFIGYQNCGPSMGRTKLSSNDQISVSDGLYIPATRYLVNKVGLSVEEIKKIDGKCVPVDSAVGPAPDEVQFADGTIYLECSHYEFIKDLVTPNIPTYQFFVEAIKSKALVINEGFIKSLHLSAVDYVENISAVIPSSVESLIYANSDIVSMSLSGGSSLEVLDLSSNNLSTVGGLVFPSTLMVLDLSSNKLTTDSSIEKLSSIGEAVVQVDLSDNKIASLDNMTNAEESYLISGNPVCTNGSSYPQNFSCTGTVNPPPVAQVEIKSVACYKLYQDSVEKVICNVSGVAPGNQEADVTMIRLGTNSYCNTSTIQAIEFNVWEIANSQAGLTFEVSKHKRAMSDQADLCGEFIKKTFSKNLADQAPMQVLQVMQNSAMNFGGNVSVSVNVKVLQTNVNQVRLLVGCGSNFSVVESANSAPELTLQGSRSVNCSPAIYKVEARDVFMQYHQYAPSGVIAQGTGAPPPPATLALTNVSAVASTVGKCKVKFTTKVTGLAPGRSVKVKGPSTWNFTQLSCQNQSSEATVQSEYEFVHGSKAKITSVENDAANCEGQDTPNSIQSIEVTCNNPPPPVPSNYQATVMLASRELDDSCRLKMDISGLNDGRIATATIPNGTFKHFVNGQNQIFTIIPQGSSATIKVQERLGTTTSPGAPVGAEKNLGSINCEDTGIPSQDLQFDPYVVPVHLMSECAIKGQMYNLKSNRSLCLSFTREGQGAQTDTMVIGPNFNGEIARVFHFTTMSFSGQEVIGNNCETTDATSIIGERKDFGSVRCLPLPATDILVTTDIPCKIELNKSTCRVDYRYFFNGVRNANRSRMVWHDQEVVEPCGVTDLEWTQKSIEVGIDTKYISASIYDGTSCDAGAKIKNSLRAIRGECDEGLVWQSTGSPLEGRCVNSQ